MWIKLLLCLLIIAFCTLLGYFAAGKYRARRRFYRDFSAFNDAFLHELEYARRPLPSFLKEIKREGEFNLLLLSVTEQRGKCDLKFIGEEERKEADEYFSMLGKGTALSQKNYFSSKRDGLLEKKGICEKEAKERGDLYLKLGLLAGLAFVILIV